MKAASDHAQTLAQQLEDQTFVTDDEARVWQTTISWAVEYFRGSLQVMLDSLGQNPINQEALLRGMEHAVAAERYLRSAHKAATAAVSQFQQNMERSQQIKCIRCGHVNRAGASTCESCRFQLPNVGAERVEVDIIGGDPVRESAFIARLRELIGHLQEPGGKEEAADFLTNLEKLQALAASQLTALMQRHDPKHVAVVRTQELKGRILGVRDMVVSVRESLQNGDPGAIHNLPSWLEREFDAMHDLKRIITEATAHT